MKHPAQIGFFKLVTCCCVALSLSAPAYAFIFGWGGNSAARQSDVERIFGSEHTDDELEEIVQKMVNSLSTLGYYGGAADRGRKKSCSINCRFTRNDVKAWDAFVEEAGRDGAFASESKLDFLALYADLVGYASDRKTKRQRTLSTANEVQEKMAQAREKFDTALERYNQEQITQLLNLRHDLRFVPYSAGRDEVSQMLAKIFESHGRYKEASIYWGLLSTYFESMVLFNETGYSAPVITDARQNCQRYFQNFSSAFGMKIHPVELEILDQVESFFTAQVLEGRRGVNCINVYGVALGQDDPVSEEELALSRQAGTALSSLTKSEWLYGEDASGLERNRRKYAPASGVQAHQWMLQIMDGKSHLDVRK